MTQDGKLHDIPPFARVPEKLLHDTNITDGAIRLYAHMVWRYGSNQKNYEGRISVAKYLGVSITTISNRIRELESNDWIVVVDRFASDKGNQTPFYHVFLSQGQARKFRTTYKCAEGESIRAKTAPETRKTRRGIGGKPSHPVNSGLPPTPVNLSLIAPFNSSWLNLYALYLDALNTPLPPKQGDDLPKSLSRWKEHHYERFGIQYGTELHILMELDGYSMVRFHDLNIPEKERLVKVVMLLNNSGVNALEYVDLLADRRKEWPDAPITVMPQHVTKFRQSRAKQKPAEDKPKPAHELSSYELQKMQHEGADFEWQ